MRDYNQQFFDTRNNSWKEEYEELMNFLLKDNDTSYNDIHVYREEGYIYVEWCQKLFDMEFGGVFKYVEDDEVVMKEKYFPDNSSIYTLDEEEWDRELSKWLEENPGWEKNQYGMWYKEQKEEEKDQTLFDYFDEH